MASSAADVIIRFLADATSVEKEVAKVQGTGAKISKWAKGVGLAIGGAFAVKAVSDWIDAAEEADSVSAGLQKTLKNAGDLTGDWAKHAEDLAGAMSRKVGIDDETIKKGQTILATFHNVSGEIGQQAGIFDRATKASVDLSKAGFGTVEDAAKVLGKALENPAKGISALQRVGITFTDKQKAVIQAFLDSGDKASAMGAIMDVVEGQVGGVAEKTVTASDKMQVAWGETKEALGRTLLPLFEELAPLLETVAGFVEKNATWLVPMALGIAAVALAIKAWVGAQTLLNGVLATFGVEEGIVLGPILLIALALLAVVAAVVVLYAKWDEVWSFIGNLPWYAKVGLAILVLTNPVLLLIAVTAALAAKWDQVWSFIANLAAYAKTGAQIVGLTAAIGVVVTALAFLASAWAVVWGAISNVTSQVVGFIRANFDTLRSIIQGIADVLWHVVDAAKEAVNWLGKLKDAAEGSPLPFGINVPGVPFLGAGGIVRSPTLAMIGEAGPEAVIPLGRGMAPSVGGGNVTINVNVTGLGADAPHIQSAIVAALRGYVGRNGPIAGIAG